MELIAVLMSFFYTFYISYKYREDNITDEMFHRPAVVRLHFYAMLICWTITLLMVLL